MTKLVLISIIAYLLGSFPTAYLFVKIFSGQDIRKIGSGNVGAMNVVRALKDKSKKLAITGFLVVLIIDMAKAALSIFFIQFFLPLNSLVLILATFFVILGHNYSIFLKFTGGRGAASLIGVMLYLDIFSFIIWGLPVVFCTILAQIILEKTGFEQKINWQKISAIVAIFGKQMAGRMAGLILALIPLYFYDPQIFLPIAAGTILLLIRNTPRFKGYFLGEKISE
ncbi:MAG: glycerol-3-phosphate acyltransferase [Patescibacteria group bacterium]|nr:glycerol-3-phosphate acyltransferase [Patescibacteria group bacterium]